MDSMTRNIMNNNPITRSDIMSMTDFAKVRQVKRRALVELKRNRRVPVGPDATFYFENWDTMWFQIHEMLFIEKGGESQISGELDAYNPMIPNGNELVTTLMFEVDDPKRRANLLGRIGGVEDTVTLQFADHEIRATSEEDVGRITETGKTSSVHFIHFPFSNKQIETFRSSNAEIVVGFSHQNYTHSAGMNAAVRIALGDDFD